MVTGFFHTRDCREEVQPQRTPRSASFRKSLFRIFSVTAMFSVVEYSTPTPLARYHGIDNETRLAVCRAGLADVADRTFGIVSDPDDRHSNREKTDRFRTGAYSRNRPFSTGTAWRPQYFQQATSETSPNVTDPRKRSTTTSASLPILKPLRRLTRDIALPERTALPPVGELGVVETPVSGSGKRTFSPSSAADEQFVAEERARLHAQRKASVRPQRFRFLVPNPWRGVRLCS